MIPDAEAVIGDHLRSELDDVAVVGRTPRDTSEPWVRVTMLDGPAAGAEADHLLAAYVQLDCYAGAAGGQAEAVTIGRGAREALRTIKGVHGSTVVTGARIEGHSRVPDEAMEPTRERVILTATVWMHA